MFVEQRRAVSQHLWIDVAQHRANDRAVGERDGTAAFILERSRRALGSTTPSREEPDPGAAEKPQCAAPREWPGPGRGRCHELSPSCHQPACAGQRVTIGDFRAPRKMLSS